MTVQTTPTLLDAVTVPADQGRAIVDAATRELIGHAPVHTEADLEAAIDAATQAQPAWEALGHAERSRILTLIADDIDANAEELAVLLSREQGKPLNGPNARFEVGACSGWLRSTAALQLDTEIVFQDGAARGELRYEALGVVGTITPWNWPQMITVWQIAPALRMGNTVITKPSGYTPLSVLALIEIFNRHLPAGVLTALSASGKVGAILAAHPAIAKVMFTGSTETGRKIVAASAQNLARLTLELGGNDAGIVLPGTDIAARAESIFWGAFVNTGQTCAALKRLYVHESQYEEAVAAIAAIAEQMPIGNGLDEGNVLGPLQNEAQFNIVADLVDDARAGGARIVTGGAPAADLGPLFYKPTIVADIQDGSRLVDEEQFGPALPIISYSTVEEAVARANGLDVGLASSVWGEDDAEIESVVRRLKAGTVWINQHAAPNPLLPFGGVKSSGYGLEFGVEGLKAVAAPKSVSR